MESLNNKTIWITGASSGIGEALAYELSEKDCNLILSSRKISALEKVKRGCANTNRIEIYPLDLIDYKEMENHVKTCIQFFGNIDILINNAGVSQRSLISDTNLEVDKKIMDINYLGTVALSKALLPYFLSKSAGYFVVVTSLMGKFGSPYRSSYCAAKHALHGFFDVMRMEHQKDNIKVTVICPGFIQTNVAKNALTGDGFPQKTNDKATANGMPSHIFAKKMIRAIERQKYEAYIGGKEVSGIFLKRFFPKLLHRIVLRSKVK